ncbi:nicotinamide riboside transporter PnuC [Blattabacterium cuenoti]|uniref:nicotinamide riboside transporter PnuC n=1 Tax=Blattabacterium cuenoti TaxID=1653831 RepID=UPI00163C2D75|nr:nicotinamide riboside transporter PnuC [Blattabacterium cuenoti]
MNNIYENYIQLFLYFNNNFISITLEFFAVIFTIVSVILAKKNNILVYPIGIISTIIYCYLTYVTGLYGDFIINIYYTTMSIYGWYMWKNRKEKIIYISFCNKKDYLHTLVLFLTTVILSTSIYYFNGKLTCNYDWIDVLTTGIFFSGMYQMSIKKVENWIFWIIGNAISVPIYFIKGFLFTAILFIILFFLAVEGFLIWKKIAINNINLIDSQYH